MTSAFALDTEQRMNFYKHMQSRRRRRLPHVERSPSRQLHNFWPTFRGALAWMRKNQDTINTAVGLLDIYPSLIQDRSLDRLWDFIKPFISQDASVKTRQTDSNKSETVKSSRPRECPRSKKVTPQIPTISVTNDLDDDADDVIKDSDMIQRKTRIYLSGQSQTYFLSSPYSKLTPELNSEYFVLPPVPNTHSASKVCEALADSDIFVFLMSQESVSNPSSYRDLSAAWTMDIPVLFIKPPAFKLPNPLPDSVILYTLESQRKFPQHRSGRDKSFAHSVTPSFGSNLSPAYRNSSALPSSARLRPSSAHEMSSQVKHPLVHRDSCDLVLMLINGYRAACIWDPIKQQQSYEEIKNRIEKSIVKMFPATPTPSVDITGSGLFLTRDESKGNDLKPEAANHLQVPNFNIHSPLNVSLDDLHDDDDDDDDDVSIHLPSLAPSPMLHSLSDPEDVTNPVEKETFYVVFKNPRSPGNVIKWPPAGSELEQYDVFADSPLSFKDVDLTLDMKSDLADTSDCDSSAGTYQY